MATVSKRRMKDLVNHYGSNQAAEEALNIGAGSFSRWLNGYHGQTKATRKKLNDAWHKIQKKEKKINGHVPIPHQQLQALYDHHGGSLHLANALGKQVHTVDKWLGEQKTCTPKNRDLILQAYQNLTPPAAEQLKKGAMLPGLLQKLTNGKMDQILKNQEQILKNQEVLAAKINNFLTVWGVTA